MLGGLYERPLSVCMDNSLHAVSSRGLGQGLCHCFLQQLEKSFSSLDSSCTEGHPQHLERRGVMDSMNENELLLLRADAPGKLSDQVPRSCWGLRTRRRLDKVTCWPAEPAV